MDSKPSPRSWTWLAAIVVVAAAIIALNWQGFSFAVAVALAERRPVLLADAQQDDPRSARRFSNRFHQGTSEADLLAWLESNKFVVDRDARQARRLVHGLPCNESIEITWSKTSSDLIGGAEARVFEAGCL